ncbi:hypothetical protein RZS08_41950, partial [Arthrospira platensis SPKY1]|nr:hypothetical protein [Arthrospira platensis SPKY1]
MGTTLLKIEEELETFINERLLKAPSFVEAWQQVVPHVETVSGVVKALTVRLCANVPWNNMIPVLGNLHTLWTAAFKKQQSWYSL